MRLVRAHCLYERLVVVAVALAADHPHRLSGSALLGVRLRRAREEDGRAFRNDLVGIGIGVRPCPRASVDDDQMWETTPEDPCPEVGAVAEDQMLDPLPVSVLLELGFVAVLAAHGGQKIVSTTQDVPVRRLDARPAVHWPKGVFDPNPSEPLSWPS
jgi:hypothetical protein